MNGYDFDKTIYRGDSTRDFFFYCLSHHPSLLRFLPIQGWQALRWRVFHCQGKTAFKEQFYRFFTGIKDMDALLQSFWDSHIQNIKTWYLAQKKEDDLIISASPEFLLRPAMQRLGLKNLIASRVDCRTGQYTGKNCWGEEKVRRFHAELPDAEIENFYSDSLSDTPMARLAAAQCFIVADNTLIPWTQYAAQHEKPNADYEEH